MNVEHVCIGEYVRGLARRVLVSYATRLGIGYLVHGGA